MVFGIADMNFGLGDNSVETIVFGNTEISHPFNHTVPKQSMAGYP